MSDGQYSLPFLSPDNQLQEYIPASQSNRDLQKPVRAVANLIELRVSDCFVPPKVEAFVKSFCDIESLDSNIPSHLIPHKPVPTAFAVADLLRKYVETKGARGGKNDMSSPMSIRTQPSPIRTSLVNKDTCVGDSGDSSPISQVRLATQAPMLDSSHALRRPLGEIKHNVSRQPQTKSTSGVLEGKSGQLILTKENAPGTEIRDEPQNNTQHLDSTDESQAHPRPFLPQSQARNSTLEQEDQSHIDDAGSSKPRESDKRIDQGALAQLDMQVRFRRWRAEAAAGRYIPRRACEISKDQLQILESDARWQPPLPGRDKRPGTVPIDLLNELTTRADQTAKQPESVAEPTSGGEVEREGLVRPVSSSLGDIPSSQELGESRWPASPERNLRTEILPPDSSLPSPGVEPDERPAAAPSVELERQSQDPEEMSTRSSRASQYLHSGAVNLSNLTNAVTATMQRPLSSPRPHQVSNVVTGSHIGHAATSTDSSNHHMSQKVQVSETPYPGKPYKSGRSNVAIDVQQHPDASYVPSTYLEGTPRKMQANLNPADPDRQSTEPGGASKQSSKRKAVDTSPVATKRAKLQATDLAAQITDPAYTPVFQDIREYRRQTLQPLTKDFAQKGHATFSKSGSSDVSTEQSHPSERAVGSKARHSGEGVPQVSTPLTVPSSRPVSKNGLGTRALSLATGFSGPSQLFERFKATYSDYQGGQTHFDTAIALLTRLRQSRKDPHPSLFDDFIWHHFHSYLPYILSFDSDDSPLPYGHYYNKYIESPSHLARVITASIIDQRRNSESRSNDASVQDTTSIIRASSHQERAEVSAHNSTDVSAAPAQVEAHAIRRGTVVKGDSEQPAEHIVPSQKSSVETWLEGTARAASPELGTRDDERPPESLRESEPQAPGPRPALRASEATPSRIGRKAQTEKRKKKRLSASPFTQSLRSNTKKILEGDDERQTPFKRWANAVLGLSSELATSSTVKKPAQPVNIFAWK